MTCFSSWVNTVYETFVAGGAWLTILKGLGVTLEMCIRDRGCIDAFDNIHPTIRDMVYDAMEL